MNFYGGNKLSTTLADGSSIALTQVTDYPWDGSIQVSLDSVATEKPISLHFRIPGWAENSTVTVNSVATDVPPVPGSYLELYRYWTPGDEIVLDFPMPVRLMEANPKVSKLHDKVAVMRGPVVYCLELPKQEGGETIYSNGVFFPEDIQLTPEYLDEYLGGVTVLKGRALTRKGMRSLPGSSRKGSPGSGEDEWQTGQLYRPINAVPTELTGTETVEIELIPYYAWANRGLAYMDVWIPLAR